MTIAADTLAGGSANQDRLFLAEGFAFVLDGASNPDAQTMDGGVYADFLHRELSQRLLNAPGVDLAHALRDAIAHLAQQWSLEPGRAPSSTVAILRWTDTYAEGLVLGDSPIIAILTDGEIGQLRDDRLAAVGRAEHAAYVDALRRGDGYGDGHRQRLRRLVAAQRAHRNTSDGYWIAEARPEAAMHAFRRRWPLADLRALIIATDGLTRGVEQLGTPATWADALDIARTRDVDTLLRLVHDTEATDPNGQRWPRSKPHDDKTAILATFRHHEASVRRSHCATP